MSVGRAVFLAAMMPLAAGAPAAAQVVLDGVHWQGGHADRGRIVAWQDLRILIDGPPKLDHRLRARLVIRNRGPKPAGALLIRYSMIARIAADGQSGEGAWAIPFFVGQRHVPKIGPNETIDVPLEIGTDLELYARRLARAGWWLDRIKVQAMLEPHPGSVSLQTVDDLLEVERGEKP